MWKYFVFIHLTVAVFSCTSKPGVNIDVTSFKKTDLNPILKADSTFVFFDPIKKDTVRWQRADVFNPAAIVKDGKVYLLYRC